MMNGLLHIGNFAICNCPSEVMEHRSFCIFYVNFNSCRNELPCKLDVYPSGIHTKTTFWRSKVQILYVRSGQEKCGRPNKQPYLSADTCNYPVSCAIEQHMVSGRWDID